MCSWIKHGDGSLFTLFLVLFQNRGGCYVLCFLFCFLFLGKDVYMCLKTEEGAELCNVLKDVRVWLKRWGDAINFLVTKILNERQREKERIKSVPKVKGF